MVTATKVEGTGKSRRYTCAAGTAITKGTILTLSDPRTAAEVSASPDAGGYIFAGIASMDKDSTDASTSISAWIEGVFEVSASGSITAGQFLKSCGTGYFLAASAIDIASGAICGRALETAADREVFNAYFGGLV